MKRVLIVLSCLMFAGLAVAQERTGNINGIVTDLEKNALPGVTVTLTGLTTSPIATTTSAEGKFRFLSLFPGREYQIKIELQGFKTGVQTGIIVELGKDTDLTLTLEQGKLEEKITVVALSPVVQAKKTQVTTNVSYDQLQSLPSARDPWVVLQMAPSVFIDRENIGGSESGQQSSMMSKGSTTQEWTMDGVQITDLSSGGSPGYYDFDAFEEMNISTGMLDVEHRSPGIVVNLVTKRGGNRTSMAGRFYLLDERFQSELPASRLAELGVPGYNKTIDSKDFGFNAGGPIFKDKVWWWGSYGVNEIWVATTTNPNDKTYLTNLDAKLNFQIVPENRAEIFIQSGKKEKFGRSSSLSYPSGWDQLGKYHFGSPTIKIQDEHMFGDNVFVSARYGFTDAGFGMWPQNDRSMSKVAYYDQTASLWNNSQTWWFSDRPHKFGVAQVQYFSDNLFGTNTAHEIKVGFEVNHNEATFQGYEFAGNFYYNTNYYQPTVDWDGNGTQDIVRDAFGINISRLYVPRNSVQSTSGNKRLAAYASDTISFGRFNLTASLRWDRDRPYSNELTARAVYLNDVDLRSRENYYEVTQSFYTPGTAEKIAALIPEKSRPGAVPGKYYDTFSPRVGLTYDLFGTGKTILKLGGSMYRGGGLGTGYWLKSGTGGSMNFWWADLNKDKKCDFTELYWANYNVATRPVYRVFDDAGNFVGNYAREFGLHWTGWNWADPLALTDPYAKVDLDNWEPSTTLEGMVSIEHEIMKDFGISLTYSYRRFGNYSWARSYYPESVFPGLGNHIRSQSDYELAGTIPGTLIDPNTGKSYDTKEAAGKPWYTLKNIPETASTSYSMLTMMDSERHDAYWGLDLVVTKRLSNRWMANGSVTYQMQKSHYGPNGYTDPTGMWAYEDSIYGTSLGGNSGKVGVNFFTRWEFKISGLYQLPWDTSVSGTLSAHEGAFVGESFGIQNLLLNPRDNSRSMPTMKYDNRNRLPDVFQLNFKVEKMIRVTDLARMYFSFDLFNVLNKDTIMRQYDNSYGTFRVGADGQTTTVYTAPGSTNYKPIEIMNPMIFRLGVRFQF
jgi:hypothetical protein